MSVSVYQNKNEKKNVNLTVNFVIKISATY